MKSIISIIGVFVFSALNLVAEIPGWSTNLSATLDHPGERPVLCFFTATWCGPCKLMHIVLTDPALAAPLDQVERIVVDIDDQHTLAAQQDIEAVPTFVLFTPSGREISRMTGARAVGDFMSWLTNGMAAVTIAEAEQKRAEDQLAQAVQLSHDPNSLPGAIDKLFDLFADADPSMKKTIVGQLSSLTRQHPALLLDGMNHPRLAVRIQAANMLRDQLGGDFDIDPWAAADTRRQAIAMWREKLAAKSGPAPVP